MTRRVLGSAIALLALTTLLGGCRWPWDEDPPRLRVSPTTLSFGHPTGSKQFGIQNEGEGTLSWSISESYNWLSCSPSSGASTGEFDEVTVSVNWTNVPPGTTKNGTIAVSSNGGSGQVAVSATRPVNPVLSYTPTSISLTYPHFFTWVEIWNSGTGTLNWTASEAISWLSCSPTSGSSSGAHYSMRAEVDWSSFSEGDTKTGTINIASNGGNATISVTATRPVSAVLSHAPSSLSFTYAQGSEVFEVWNSGTSTLDWTVSEGYSWLSCSPTSGNSTGEHDPVTVTVDWGYFSPGQTKTGTITIHSNGGDSSIGVTATRPSVSPELSLSPTTLSFTEPDGDKTFDIWNSGGGVLSWSVSDDASWILCSPTSGESTGEHDEIAVTVIWAHISPGPPKTATITITSTAGTATVEVTATPVSPPTLARSPSSLSFTYAEGAQTFDIWNAGDGTLSWSVSEGYDWLSCSPTSGSSTGEHDPVSVTVSWGYFSVGETKTGTISISSNGGSATVSVTATRPAGTPVLARSPSSLSFTYPGGPATFEVWNSGGGTLSWTVSEDEYWLSCSPTSGSSTGEHDIVTVTINWSQIPEGSGRFTTVFISSNGGDDGVWVEADRPANPVMNRSPSSLSFTCSEGAKTFEIWNAGSGALSWSVSEGYNWLSCSPTSGSSTGEHDPVSVTVSWGYFSVGETKTGTISISSNGGSGTVAVTATGPGGETETAYLRLYVMGTDLWMDTNVAGWSPSSMWIKWSDPGSHPIEDPSWNNCPGNIQNMATGTGNEYLSFYPTEVMVGDLGLDIDSSCTTIDVSIEGVIQPPLFGDYGELWASTDGAGCPMYGYGIWTSCGTDTRTIPSAYVYTSGRIEINTGYHDEDPLGDNDAGIKEVEYTFNGWEIPVRDVVRSTGPIAELIGATDSGGSPAESE